MSTYALRSVGSLVLGLSLWTGSLVHAQEDRTYRIGPEDVLSITFWQKPELNQVAVKVRQDGMASVSAAGDIRLAGLTPEGASKRVAHEVGRYVPEVRSAVVEVTQFNSRKVVVRGQVGTPAVYGYESVPDLWTVIRNAGGPTETADLSKVSVVSPSGTTTVVDLAAVLRSGKADTLPPLLPGTTIEVASESISSQTYQLEEQKREPIVHVTGGVLHPGTVPIEGELTVYDAIAMVGGFSATGDPKKLHIVSKGSNGPVLHKIDLRPTTKKRAALDYHVQSEDFIIVGQKGRSTGETIRDIGAAVAATAAIITATILVLDYMERQ